MANIQHVFAGHYDLPLSPLGQEQAEKTALFLKENFDPDEIYSSDLARALGTAKATALLTGKEIVPMTALREIFAGEWEGKGFSQLEQQYADTYSVWKTDIGNAIPDGGETVRQMASRVEKAVKQIAEQNDGKTVAVFTHATPIRVVQCLFSQKPLSEMKHIPWVSNASVTRVTYENGVFSIQEKGMDAHLGDLKTLLPKNV
jgi:probable phosphoglycerate mutase